MSDFKFAVFMALVGAQLVCLVVALVLNLVWLWLVVGVLCVGILLGLWVAHE